MSPRAVIVDSNLLVLLVVGLTSPDYIEKHKRLKEFSKSDFTLLTEVISRFAGLEVTQSVLAETSNLLGQIADPIRSEVFGVFADFIAQANEISLPSRSAVAWEEFRRLGLTDALLLELNSATCVLITGDFNLYTAAAGLGYPVVNFTHERQAAGTI